MNKMNTGIMLFLGVLTGFDMFTTLIGTMSILNSGLDTNNVFEMFEKSRTYSIVIASIFSIGIGAMLLATASLFEYAKYNSGIAKLLPVFWIVAFIYDVFTSWKGNLNLMFGNTGGLNGEQFAILATTTLFVSISAIVISYYLKD